MLSLQIPTINDFPRDFDSLFNLWEQVNDDFLEVAFDFSHCNFLRQNAVAFLGGLARLIKHRGGDVTIELETLRDDVRTNLTRNGFLAAFGLDKSPWIGNTIPYREDLTISKDEIINYLKSNWLGRGWVQVSRPLRDEMVGRVWEIYDNAVEHSDCPIGIFSCGQYYPNLNMLKLSVVDFGVGIPSNVRLFKKKLTAGAAGALRWAFMRGTTTKPNGIGRGLGLDLIKEFVKINRGKLEFYSHEGFASINGESEKYRNRRTYFEGTIINITFRCDESYYHLASETNDNSIF